MNVELTSTDPESPASQRNLVVFQLEQQTYALPIESVVQIIEMVTITPIPQVNRLMEGVINVRGVAVPVVNLRCHLGLPEAPLQLHTPIILIQVSGRMIGLIIDEGIDVLSLPADRIARPADFLPQGLSVAPILQGVAHARNGMALLLDPEHLFLPDQVEALIQAVETLPGGGVEEASAEEPVELSVETGSEVVAEEEEAPAEEPTDTQPQPARRRRKKRQRTKGASEEANLDEPAREVET